MANPNNVELDAAKFLHKLIQQSKDEPKKMATKLYVILQHMRSSGKENSMPYQVISRAKETVVKQYGLANEALMSWGLPKPVEAQVEVAFSQVTGSLQNVEVTRDMTANFLGNEMVRPDAYASISAISGSSGSGRGIYQASGSHISGYPQSATEATQDKGDAMQFDAIFEMRESFDLRQPQPATEATLDKGDTLHFDASVDMLRLSDVAQKLSAPEDLMLKLDAELEAFNQYLVTDIAYNRRDLNSSTLEDAVGRSLPRLELEIGTQSLQLDSARHQVDDVDVDAMNCQSNAVTADLEKRNKTKRIELEYGITREVIKQQFGKKLVDAANSFGVARSTFKRICRVYKIYRWPRVKSRKGSCSLAQGELSQDVDRQPSDSDARHQQYVNISPRSGPKSVANSKELLVPMLSENVISVKVTYGNRTVRFPLSLSSGKKDLEEEVEKRIEIARNSSIRYEDEENDLILITCDSDLHYAMHTFRSLGRTIIRMLVEIEPGSTMT